MSQSLHTSCGTECGDIPWPFRPDGILDLLVIGGGIVGASIARDAALRRLRVGLVDQHDFAGGTSSRSSRLLHGGLRYLAQGRVGLVRESSVEKRVLRAIAPHLAEPLGFIFPTYRGSGWPLWQLRIGVRLYDLLCSNRNLGRSRGLDRQAVLQLVPGLQPEGLSGAAHYYDALTQDARLVFDTLRSAAKAGARLANYVRYVDAEPTDAGWRITLVDAGTQVRHTVAARAIINATGPWSHGLPGSSVRLRLTKGVHLVIDRTRLPVPDAVVLTDGPRLIFAIPWGERVILGTTDTDYAGDPAAPVCEETDVDYLLRAAHRVFPAAALTRQDVIRAWAGVRPLVADQNGRPSDISRSHEIRHPRAGWWDVAGGKLTTCRLMAEQVVDRVVRELGRPASPGRTAQEPLLEPAETAGVSGLLPPPVGRAAVEHYCRREWARHLDDVMIRRTSWHYYHRDAGVIARRVLGWMAEIHGWSEADCAKEWRAYLAAAGPCFPVES